MYLSKKPTGKWPASRFEQRKQKFLKQDEVDEWVSEAKKNE